MTGHRQADTTQGTLTGRATDSVLRSISLSMSCSNKEALQQTGHLHHSQAKSRCQNKLWLMCYPTPRAGQNALECRTFTPPCKVCSDKRAQGRAKVLIRYLPAVLEKAALLKHVVTILQTNSLPLQKPQIDDAPHKLITLAATCCSSSKAYQWIW